MKLMIKMTCWHLLGSEGFFISLSEDIFHGNKKKKIVAAKTAIIDSLLANTRGISE